MSRLLVGLSILGALIGAGRFDRAEAAGRALLGDVVRIALEGRREMGIGLRATAAGWRMNVRGQATSIELIDLTSATHDKWVLPVASQPLALEGPRFQAGHAYRYELHRGITVVERGLVYLYPPRGSRSARVEFEVEANGPTSDDGGLGVIPKSAL